MRQKRYFKLAIMLPMIVSALLAGNNLTVVRNNTHSFEIQLANCDEIFGVQFSLHTSSDIVLGELERGARDAESHWIVASYKPNDSTVNVLIMSAERKNFPIGEGSLARIPFSTTDANDVSYANLTNVMITNSQADSLGIAVNNLNWNNRSALIADNDSKSFKMGQNYPNPFNPSTKIAYRLNKAAQVKLSVYDITGREVNRLVDQYQSVGEYNVDWNSNTNNGQKLASGMYVARLSVDNESVSRKMIMTK